MLKFIADNINPDLVLWTGDNISHDIWHQTIENQTLNTYDITTAMQSYWPNVSLYPMFGNHECFPADQYDVFRNGTGWLTSKLGIIWRDWLTEEGKNSKKNFKKLLF